MLAGASIYVYPVPVQCFSVNGMDISALTDLTHHLRLMPNLSLSISDSEFSYEQRNNLGIKFRVVQDGPLESLG